MVEKLSNLLLKISERKVWLSAVNVESALAAVIVRVVRSEPIDFLFGGDRESALTAPNQSGVGEDTSFPRPAGTTEKCLNMLELVERYHRGMLAGKGLSFPFQNTGIKRVREYSVNSAQ